MCVVIRADSSSTIGTGHVMRDLVLAKQFDNKVIFATRDLTGNLNDKIKSEGYQVELLKDNSIDELDSLVKRLSAEVVVIDSYEIDYSFERELKSRNPNLTIFVLDDTYEKHYCDILLNHSISALEERYKGLVPKHCELRCGSEYTLLREEFSIEKAKPKKHNDIKTVFIAMGGADHSNLNINILKVLESIGGYKTIVVSTNANKNLQELRDFCGSRNWINLEINSNKIASLINQCDFAIVTPSGTVNEVHFMGLPFIAIKTADNQKEIYQYLKERDFFVMKSFDSKELEQKIIKISAKL